MTNIMLVCTAPSRRSEVSGVLVDPCGICEADATVLVELAGLKVLASVNEVSTSWRRRLFQIVHPNLLVKSFYGTEAGVREDILDSLSKHTLAILYDTWKNKVSVGAQEVCTYVQKRLSGT